MSYKKRGGGRSNSQKELILKIITVILAILLGVFLWMNKVEEDRKSAELRALNKKLYQEEQEKQIALKQKEAEDSFYQKLVDGFDVNVLVVGDSIAENGQGEKGWCTLLQNNLRKTYNNRVLFTNVSMGGNASYAGYVRTMALNDDVGYDLAIICYGQNDGADGFSTNYESIIRAIRSKYPDCSIISILESSQREYIEKMTTIQSICEHYSIPVADTIASFNNSGKAYDDLTGDGVHPNEAGQGIYFETVKAVIDDNVAASTGKMAEADVINADVHKFDNFVWYDASSDFVRVDDTTFTISTNASGILGIDYTYESGDNKADIYVDGELFESPTVTFDYDFSQRHILVVSDDCTVKSEIKVVFNTKEQADGFKGMCFSWE
ncbi:SGNH/GDSL hydrolase family protein [Blautia obeum]|uniref:SGNH/GDSL hydrolase family protein n=1 Tax=Blautia obeum TaxID=40520 RepID=UPI000E4C2056|nr:SGNH/GDSL hydrolase family protein [Blautia obeum]RHM29864.1 SGNH/GDSL hydrolase family protein [Blautia obeum]